MKRTGTELIASDVYHRLRDQILTLEIKPGTRLVEDELTQTFGAGRTPVREALLRLQGQGLVSRGRGWVVEAVNPSAFRSIFEARIAIEGYSARLAAQKITSDGLERLESLLTALAPEEQPRSEINRLNRIFHQEIVAASDNALFVEMHERTQFQYWNLRLPVVFLRDQLRHSNEQHHLIFDALKHRDADLAERVAREHIEATLHIVSEALADD